MRRTDKLLKLLIAAGVMGIGLIAHAQPSIPKNRIPAGLSADVRQLMERLYAPDPQQRANATNRLVNQGERAVPAIPFLIAMLHDDATLYDATELQKREMISSHACIFPFPNTPGERAARALAALKRKTEKPSVDVLIGLLKDKNGQTRANAIMALGEFWEWGGKPARQPGRRVLEPLIAALKDEHPKVREYAAPVLGLLEHPRAVEPLMAAVEDSHQRWQVRRNAADALGKTRDPRALRPLIAVLNDRDQDGRVRQSAARALGAIGDPRAVEPLVAVLKDQDPQIRMAATGVACLKDSRALQPLLAALTDPHRQVREVTAGALGQQGDRGAVDALIAALGDEYPNVRARAARSLGDLGGPRVLKPVIAALQDGNSYVRWHAAQALEELADPGAVQPLKNALKDESELVRTTARRALEKTNRSLRSTSN